MTNVRKRASARNCLSVNQPDLFSWHAAPILNTAPIAARKLAQRYGITIPHAIIVARLAGIGGSEARQ